MPSWLQLQHLWLEYGAVVPIVVVLALAVWLTWRLLRTLVRSWAAIGKGVRVVNIILELPEWQASQDAASARKEQQLGELRADMAGVDRKLAGHLQEHALDRPVAEAMRAEVAFISGQVRNNHGSSLRDAIDAIRAATPGAIPGAIPIAPVTGQSITITTGAPQA